jgi:7-carboxy-7-deazaguanine synthase
MRLPVNEVFQTIQGEGYWTGRAAVFIRLQGCPVGCPFCDTKYTWAVDSADEIPVDAMLEKREAARTFAWMHSLSLAATVNDWLPRHVVLTGGEPAQYDLRMLTAQMSGKTVQIETSGCFPLQVDDAVWVTVSPKIGMPGGYQVRPDAVRRANEIKMVIGKESDLVLLRTLLDLLSLDDPRPVFVQPMSLSDKSTQLCIDAVMRMPRLRLSLQTHRMIAVR